MAARFALLAAVAVIALSVSRVHAQELVGWGVNTQAAPVVPTDLGPISKIAAGSSHTVALKQDGTVACWGRNLEVQCTVPAGLGAVTAVAAGGLHTVALKQDGTVACWGRNLEGQCTIPAGLGSVTAVAAGDLHTVALKQDGTVACWGYNFQGQCTVPAGLGLVTAVAAGASHTVALKQDGTVACWGYDFYGQCTAPAGLGSVTAVAAGAHHTVALKQDGTVACWGYNFDGQCTAPAGLGPVTAVAAGYFHTVALKQDGTVACWGDDFYGQCTVPAGLGSVTAVAPGGLHTVALKQDGTVACWGAGTTNTGSNPNWGQSIVPAGLGPISKITAGVYHTVALKQDGTVACWGAGTTNTGSFPNYGQSIVPSGLGSVTSVAAGGHHSVAVKQDGTVACWGAGTNITGINPNYGQSIVPGGIGPVTAVAAGVFHTVALKQDGTVACWGAGTTNTGGLPNYGQSIVPSGLGAVTAVAAGFHHTVAVKQGGTVACWGAGTTNTGVNPNWGQSIVPSDLGPVAAVAAGGYHTVAVKQDGTVACWGRNDFGQCTVPAGLGPVTAVAAGSSHTVALKQDGTVACWGAGTTNTGINPNYGQSIVPTGLGSVTAVTAGSTFTIALVSPPTAALSSSTSATCGLANGAITIDVTGATSLSWSGPSGFTSTSEDLTDLAAGTYTLTARGPGGTATLTVAVAATPDTTAPVITSYTASASAAANAACTATVPNLTSSVVATDNCTIASITQTPLAGASVGLGTHEVTIRVTDAAGNNAAVTSLFTVTGSPANYYADADHDGFGTGSPVTACAQPANSASVGGDQCDNDPLKQAPGVCGCGTPDTDANGNGIADCADVFLVLTPSATSVSSGGQFRVRVSASASLAPMAGLQLAMRFDHTHLRLDAVEPVSGGPFAAELAEQIDNAAGTLRYALGVDDGGGGLTSAADLCDLQFTVLPGGSLCGSSVLVTFGNVGPFTTRFTRMTGGAQVPLVANLPPINLDSVAPVISGVPSSVSVAADAGSTYGAYVAAPTVTATDDCDGTVAVGGPSWPADGMFPIGTTTLTWSATDSAGNTSSETRTITVGDYQLLDASIAFQGTLSGTSTRSVRIKAGLSTQVLTVDLTGSSGMLTGMQVPVAASYACIEAKDTMHTLTRTAAPSIAGTRYSASFLLVQGDSNDDDLVDIVDFGSFVADRGAGKAKDARSNFNADTLVNNADFTYITLNFFSVGESCTGALDGKQPRDRIHVKELRRMGLGDLAAADLNGDGWVDARDMQSYMQGGGGAIATPTAPAGGVSNGW